MDRLAHFGGQTHARGGWAEATKQQAGQQGTRFEGSVFLLDDLRTFSNGSTLEPGFALFPGMLNKCIAGRMERNEKDMGIDDMRLDAVAVHGKIGLGIEMDGDIRDAESQLVDANDTLFMVGEHGKCTF